MFVNRTVSNASSASVDGTYKCNAQLPALSVGYKF
jgi:hypothetical protein